MYGVRVCFNFIDLHAAMPSLESHRVRHDWSDLAAAAAAAVLPRSVMEMRGQSCNSQFLSLDLE